jgi:hypothetical protein
MCTQYNKSKHSMHLCLSLLHVPNKVVKKERNEE